MAVPNVPKALSNNTSFSALNGVDENRRVITSGEPTGGRDVGDPEARARHD
jgi:hypothetical protein